MKVPSYQYVIGFFRGSVWLLLVALLALPVEAARGIVAVVQANMLAAIRVVSVRKGYDPRAYTMLAFGGAMVLIMLWRPAGLLAHREPTIRLGAAGGRGPAP